MKPRSLPVLVLKHMINRFSLFLPRKKILKRNEKLKNIHKGKRCFILGSGPSIKTQDLKRLKGEIVFTQNHFHAHKDIKTINPKYHCIVPKHQDDSFNSDWIEWFTSMEEVLPSDVIYFPGLNTRKLIEENGFFKDHCHYIDHGLNPVFLRKGRIDITKRIMDVPTVLTQCLIIALYMGFSEIYLLGFDLDQIVHFDQRDKMRFYGNSHITRNDYEKKIEAMQAKTGHTFLFYWWIYQQLNLLKKNAEEQNTKIYNCAPGGLLYCFDRKNYEELNFLKKKKKTSKGKTKKK